MNTQIWIIFFLDTKFIKQIYCLCKTVHIRLLCKLKFKISQILEWAKKSASRSRRGGQLRPKANPSQKPPLYNQASLVECIAGQAMPKAPSHFMLSLQNVLDQRAFPSFSLFSLSLFGLRGLSSSTGWLSRRADLFWLLVNSDTNISSIKKLSFIFKQ